MGYKPERVGFWYDRSRKESDSEEFISKWLSGWVLAGCPKKLSPQNPLANSSEESNLRGPRMQKGRMRKESELLATGWTVQTHRSCRTQPSSVRGGPVREERTSLWLSVHLLRLLTFLPFQDA